MSNITLNFKLFKTQYEISTKIENAHQMWNLSRRNYILHLSTDKSESSTPSTAQDLITSDRIEGHENDWEHNDHIGKHFSIALHFEFGACLLLDSGFSFRKTLNFAVYLSSSGNNLREEWIQEMKSTL